MRTADDTIADRKRRHTTGSKLFGIRQLPLEKEAKQGQPKKLRLALQEPSTGEASNRDQAQLPAGHNGSECLTCDRRQADRQAAFDAAFSNTKFPVIPHAV